MRKQNVLLYFILVHNLPRFSERCDFVIVAQTWNRERECWERSRLALCVRFWRFFSLFLLSSSFFFFFLSFSFFLSSLEKIISELHDYVRACVPLLLLRPLPLSVNNSERRVNVREIYRFYSHFTIYNIKIGNRIRIDEESIYDERRCNFSL